MRECSCPAVAVRCLQGGENLSACERALAVLLTSFLSAPHSVHQLCSRSRGVLDRQLLALVLNVWQQTWCLLLLSKVLNLWWNTEPWK